MSIIVTGAAGFIGSNLVKALNLRGERDIIAVDDLTDGDKCRNLADCDIAHYFDKRDFVQRFADRQLGDVRAVLHQGACSSTVEHDGRLMMDNNYRYSCDLLQACQDQSVPLVYASSAAVYGSGTDFREVRECERALNVYGWSKSLFDQQVRQLLPRARSQIVGVRYFNVYGPREQHKGRMASMVWHCVNQYRERGFVELFGEYGNYPAGGHLRDFVSVQDVVKVNLHWLDHPHTGGIFNVGTGRARSFNDLALATINSLRAAEDRPPLTLETALLEGVLRYCEFPDSLKGKYQVYTCADLTQLREAGYREPMLTLEEGVQRYIGTINR
ncbi:ADP-glyceromanno-heptose 6-epimerase [Pseudomonas weihenstephanensis]|uniref:ADP-L-glycero-D-manno-heptose-6-epimerase n=1 Tax=Pseudomonas weihenstephanensis TaxID=1608994 RepID=A0A0J6LTL1_9PSED|nr:ADP-glyceromanno-heptose 6-epimerase [Pseudomonas weihenstephanensis]KMN13288.1 ADP-L-glycero-D-manno-heptose-6-epimerase [Pseudomonas weihenstephanensis]KMN17791.1 ADP-L-glycero-D-manno-heptose-6-epimerase [Pseudomonas weihenstephanensis]MBM1191759.1 ADP-glyceromanno-heptose 6-epimerase [Pseudomonas weihenstephanensis]GLX91026.1 ADP-L-glycero-D-manno-heptose-6-epimerase [Pseudomonas fragi]